MLDFRLILGLEENVDTIFLPDGFVVSLDDFAERFANAEIGTYAEFLAIDDGKKGYKEYFDKLKSEGILL